MYAQRVRTVCRRIELIKLICFIFFCLPCIAYSQGQDVEELIRQLKDENPEVRKKAAMSLGQLEDGRALNPLLTALTKDKDNMVRSNAAEALGKLQDTRALGPLINALKNDEDYFARWGIVKALGELKDPKAVEPLISTINGDPEENVRYSAIQALAMIDDPRVVAAIIGVLDDADSKIRVNAAYALLDLKDPRVVEIRPRLLKIMEEDANISLITYYDNFGRPEYITVRNVVGGFIASMQFEFNKYNNTLIAKATVRKKRFGKILQVTDYDIYGRPKNTKWLCLDLKGNIITKDGKPVLVAPLKIGLKTSSKNYYLGFSHYITRTNTKVYPSKKCEEWTDVRNCRYVWQMPVLANQKLFLFPGVRYSL